MRKYLFIFKTTIIEMLQYIPNLLFGFVSFITMIYVLMNLWQYIYSDPNEVIGGLTSNQMIWYVLFSEVLYSLKNKKLVADIHEDIKTGDIAYKINKPYNYIGYLLSRNAAHIVINTVLYLVIGITLGIILIGPLKTFNVANLPFIIITFILSVTINSFIKIGISLLSFWIEDSWPFHWVYDKSLLVLGTVFPIDVFPRALQGIIKLTPVFVTSYGPAKLIVDFSMGNFTAILIAQIIYLVILSFILRAMFKKGVRKLNVNGG